MNDCTYSTRTLCFLAGGLAGITATLLLAPQSGKTTREAVRRTLREGADSAGALKKQVIRRSEEVRDEATHRVTAAASALAGNGADDSASA
jgi:gas vesicle protein